MLSKNIKALRVSLGYSQEQIANYLGISAAAISQYENEARAIPCSTITKLALLFNVEECELYKENPQHQQLLSAFAFRAEQIEDNDLKSIVDFKKIVLNYFHLSNALQNE